jgi:hypothetical protein
MVAQGELHGETNDNAQDHVKCSNRRIGCQQLPVQGEEAAGFQGVVYPVNEVAAKHGASVLEETSKPAEAYANFGPEERSAYREGWLP